MSSELARRFIAKFLGEYISNLNSDTITIGLWSGYVNCEELEINPSAFDRFNLPMQITYGKIGKIFLSLPIKSFLLGIASTVEIVIERIDLFIKTKADWSFFDYTNFDYKEKVIRRLTDELLLKIQMSQNPQLNDTYLNRTINYLLDNIKVNIRDMTLIFEDTHSHLLYNMIGGIKIERLTLETDYVENTIMSKSLQVNGWSTFLIPAKKNNKINFNFSALSSGFNFINNSSEVYSDASKELIELKDYFILSPLKARLTLKKKIDIDVTHFDINIDIAQININIEKKQFISLLSLIRFIENYKQFFKNCYSLRKLSYNKPPLDNRLMLLSHYCKGVLHLIKERKYNLDFFSLENDIETYRDIFNKEFLDYYFHITTKPSNDFIAVIRYVDESTLNQWIQLNINSIYSYQKNHSGFFCGVMSYFYTNAIENIKLDSIINPEPFNFKLELHGIVQSITFSISNLHKDTSKIIFREITLSLVNLSELNAELTQIKILYIDKINNSFFTTRIVKPTNANDNTKAFRLHFSIMDNKPKLQINLRAHSFTYHQNLAVSIISFLSVKEFDKYAHHIFDLSTHDFLLQDDNKDKPNCAININIENQQLVFLYKSSNERFIINLGDMIVSSQDSKEFAIEVKKINIEFRSNDDKIKVNLIDDFYFDLFLLQKKYLIELTCAISDIKLNIDNLTLSKLLSLKEIFLYEYEKDLWETKFTAKDLIYNNNIKKGFLLNKNSNGWDRYYSLLSGGYIYLFSNSSNDCASLHIPLSQSTISDLKQISNSQNETIYYYEITSKQGKVYQIGFIIENHICEWKKIIEKRIEEIAASITFTTPTPESLTSIQSIANIEQTITVKDYDRVINKIKAMINNDIDSHNTSNVINTKDNAQYNLRVNVQLNSLNIYSTINHMNTSIDFNGLQLFFGQNDLFAYCEFCIETIQFKHENVYILTNELEVKEKVVDVKFQLYNKDVFNVLFNQKFELDKISLDDNLTMFIRNIGRTKLTLSFGHVELLFEHEAVSNLIAIYNNIQLLITPSPTEEDERVITNVRELSDSAVLISVDVSVKYFGVMLLNKQSKLESFSFNLQKIFFCFQQKKTDLTMESYVKSLGFYYVQTLSGNKTPLIASQALLPNEILNDSISCKYSSDNSGIDSIQLTLSQINIKYYHLIIKTLTYIIKEELIPLASSIIVPKNTSKLIKVPPKYRSLILEANLNQVKLMLPDKKNDAIYYYLSIENIRYESKNNIYKLKLFRSYVLSYDNYQLCLPSQWDFEIIKSKDPDIGMSINVPLLKFKFRRRDYVNIFNIIETAFISPLKSQINKQKIGFRNSLKKKDSIKELNTLQTYKTKFHINVSSLIVILELASSNSIEAHLDNAVSDIKLYSHKKSYFVKVNNISIEDDQCNLLSHSNIQHNTTQQLIESNKINNQFIIQITKEKISKRLLIDITLMDVNILLKMDLCQPLTQFFERKSLRRLRTQSKKSAVKVNALLSNNAFYLKTQENLEEQELLALELNTFISYEKNSEKDQANLCESQQFRFQIQNMSMYLMKIMKIDANTNFNEIYNKKILLEPLSVICDIKIHSSLKAALPIKQVELYLFSNKIKMKLSFDDIFFIYNTLQFNLELIKLALVSKQLSLSSTEESIYIAKAFKKENEIEAFVKVNQAEFLLVNEVKECYSPHLIVQCEKVKIVLMKADDLSTQLKAYFNLQLNYYNYKTSIWEPFIESNYLEIFGNYSSGNINNILLNSPNECNINVTEEFIFVFMDCYKNIEYRLTKESNRKLNKAISVSNHLLINLSGEDIQLCCDDSKEYSIKNGESFDLERINIRLIQQLIFPQSKVNVAFKSLKSSSEIIPDKIWFNIELQHMKKNYVFYSKYIIENNSSNKLIVYNGDLQFLLRNEDKLGVGEVVTIFNNYQNSNKVVLTDIKYLTYHPLDNLIINVEKVKLNTIQTSIYKFKVYPSIVVQNCLDAELIFEISQQILIIEPNSIKHIFLNRIQEDINAIRPFKIKFKYKNYSFKSEECSPLISKNDETITNIVNSLDEHCILKVNSTEINGVIYLYIYFDYIVINSTRFDISPHDSKLDFDYNDHHYYPVECFDKLDLEFNEGNMIIPLKEICVTNKNYAFFKEIEVKRINSTIKLMFQRQLRYLKFTQIKKVDILLISQIINQDDKTMSTLSYQNNLLARTPSTTSLCSLSSANVNESNNSNVVIASKCLSQFVFNIHCINLSLIASVKGSSLNERKELLLLSLNTLIITFAKELRMQKELIFILELKLKNIQIDNMTNSLNSFYKVALSKVDTKSKGNFIHFITEYKESVKYLFDISKIEFFIQPIGIFIDSEFSADLINFFFTFNDLIAGKIFYMENIHQILQSIKMVKVQKKLQKKIYINHIKTSQINFIFAYKNISNRLFDVLNIKSSIIQNVIDVFTNSTHISINLNSLEMYNVSGDKKDIINKFFDYYYFNFIQQGIKILFSIDILGNPFGLIEKLGKGVKDFFYLPIAGVINGPSEFFIGSFSGTKSLISHALGGALDSTHKIASSLGTNILKLTNSDDYLRSRNSIMQRYSHLKQDKYITAFHFLINGVKYGIRDFVLFPYMYYKNGGPISLLKGCLFGSTSIIVKPASGLLDFLSFFSHDIAKKVLSQYELSLRFNHHRENRIFWDNDYYITNYNNQNELYEIIATNQAIIDKIADLILQEENYSLSLLRLNSIFLLKESKNRYAIILIMNEHIIILRAKQNPNDLIGRIKRNKIEIEHAINIVSITQVSTSFNLIKIIYIDKLYKNRFSVCILKPDCEKIREQLYSALMNKYLIKTNLI